VRSRSIRHQRPCLTTRTGARSRWIRRPIGARLTVRGTSVMGCRSCDRPVCPLGRDHPVGSGRGRGRERRRPFPGRLASWSRPGRLRSGRVRMPQDGFTSGNVSPTLACAEVCTGSRAREGRVTAVDDVSFTVASGAAGALAGVGGSGRPCQDFPGMSALGVHGMVRELLEAAGLIPPARCAAELPHELSGAQCQPVVTAGALACDAGLIILREPVLMLDVSLRAGRAGAAGETPRGSVAEPALHYPRPAQRTAGQREPAPQQREVAGQCPAKQSFITRERTARAAVRRGGDPCAAAGGQPSHTT
jgi:hypothetical protein